MADVILEPPAAPTTSFTLFVLSARTAGHMEDIGRFPGLMKLAGEGGMPNALVILGEEKSSISSLNKIPVLFPVTPEPNLKNKIFVRVFFVCVFFFFGGGGQLCVQPGTCSFSQGHIKVINIVTLTTYKNNIFIYGYLKKSLNHFIITEIKNKYFLLEKSRNKFRNKFIMDV